MSFLPAIYLFLGLAVIWFSSELLTKGALSIASKIGWSKSFVGLSLLSFCSNLPEIIISFSGAFRQMNGINSSGLVLGNIIGSNISQISLILGIAGLLKVLKTQKKELIWVSGFLILSTALLWRFSMDGFISSIEGLQLLGVYVVYLLALPLFSKTKTLASRVNKLFAKHSRIDFVKIIFGLLLMTVASDCVLKNAVLLANQAQINQSIIGIFLIGLGTSLPELFVTFQAIRWHSSDLSVGTILGSNIIGSSLAIGGSALFVGWSVDRSMVSFDIPFLLLLSVVVILFLLTRGKLERKEAILMLWMYLIFCVLKLLGF